MNTTLSHLNISNTFFKLTGGNNIQTEGSIYISRALIGNKSLRILELCKLDYT